jgi:protein SCO1/2
MRHLKSGRLAAALLLAAACAHAGDGGRREETPPELQGVGITEHLGAQVPLDLEFRDEEGRTVRLRDYFQGERPVILTLNYSNCPMLCSLQLNALVDGLRGLASTPGQEFVILTVSIDPHELPPRAKLTQRRYIEAYGKREAAAGWHFLTGREENIRALAGSVGFGYRWDEESKSFLHAAALFVLTPEGQVSRYLYGVLYEPQDLKLALLEASQGKLGTTLDRIILYCFHYDAAKGHYAPAAIVLMQAAGSLFVLVLGFFLVRRWVHDWRQGRAPAPGGGGAP